MNKSCVALVLAGGVGTRFWPFEQDKILFPFLGHPFIEESVKNLPQEVNKVVIVTNNSSYAELKKVKFSKPTVIVIQQAAKGMADAILSAKNEIAGSELLIIIADHLVDNRIYDEVIRIGRDKQVSGVLPGWKTEKYFPGGYLELNGTRITGIKEKPGFENVPSNYVYVSGNYIADSDILISELEKVTSETDNIYELALSNLMKHSTFIMFPYEGFSSSLKYSWNVLDVMHDILENQVSSHRGREIFIGSNVTIKGDVYIGNGVKIFENTKIVGPVYIGDRTIIGNNNIIRESMIGADCICGFSTDIARSYIGNNCWFHSNYIGDSVLMNNISMGAGAILANVRLDESEIYSNVKNERIGTGRTKLGACIGNSVRIGVNASIMPGIKIGENSQVGAGIVLSRDIPCDSFCTGVMDIDIRKNQTKLPISRDAFRRELRT
jgi:UDP-N-acetylglucosamine diphosphorylase / glucose-1-phosphate thymidylyltransferase / UDP-N-acetylgalactosamine diphosphorylase / glucosamine-1-phosphate N-acetyltransferase / galactosamine-1-phosphate N-acetyltransferase